MQELKVYGTQWFFNQPCMIVGMGGLSGSGTSTSCLPGSTQISSSQQWTLAGILPGKNLKLVGVYTNHKLLGNEYTQVLKCVFNCTIGFLLSWHETVIQAWL